MLFWIGPWPRFGQLKLVTFSSCGMCLCLVFTRFLSFKTYLTLHVGWVGHPTWWGSDFIVSLVNFTLFLLILGTVTVTTWNSTELLKMICSEWKLNPRSLVCQSRPLTIRNRNFSVPLIIFYILDPKYFTCRCKLARKSLTYNEGS